MAKNSLLAREIEKLKTQFLLLGGKVEDRFREAIDALGELDQEKAGAVVDGDREIDLMEVNLEEECLKILALYQPVAVDLRFIITVLKVNSDLERIGDLAVNISEAVLFLSQGPSFSIPFDFTDMADKAGRMVRDSLNALVDQDILLADNVRRSDGAVDAVYEEACDTISRDMKAHPEHVDALLQAVRISTALERIGDLACNIAEDVIYLADGSIVRH